MSVAAIVVAAGRGARAGGGIPKQYRALAGKPVIVHALRMLLAHPSVGTVLPVVHADDRPRFDDAVSAAGLPSDKLREPVLGGATRQDSVRRGLEALNAEAPDLVLVHDAARPFLTPGLVARAVAAGRAHGAAVPGIPVTDTIKVVDERARVVETPDRTRLRAVQTPQAFAFPALLDAHRWAAEAGRLDFPDDGALAEWAGLSVTVFDGEPGNVKLTHEADFAEAERRLGPGPGAALRVGTGFDVHALTAGDHVWLGGVRIPAERGIIAHSDGDVVLHALTDAVLGALAEGDIGVHFPPSDPQWRGASSDRFLAFAIERVRLRGGTIDNLDVTVLCEAPRIGPHRDLIRETIAAIAGVPLGAVSVKATTTERLGFIGRGEGIAAQAVAAVRLPPERA
ncbi:MAG TPA: bifunctional 2-C-methyl-D-erythritol 4-phosphate cytidylyltransferase/2-C-methyl-D-erythritol 2,4-cyclodiphosphate synthase [Beijerinckiaceae bacterium]|jgi:2-C-methyl-D-erythritol 4-phosphate cytidylyltransferase/2-C-methyl-D-erythritol 2,4-cyclodiphosphate synthase